MSIKELLEENLASEITKLSSTRYDDNAYGAILDTVVKLADRKIEMDKVENEQLFREKQRADERKERLIRYGIAVAELVVLTSTTVWGVSKSFEFEKTGTITTIMGRGFINKLVPKR